MTSQSQTASRQSQAASRQQASRAAKPTDYIGLVRCFANSHAKPELSEFLEKAEQLLRPECFDRIVATVNSLGIVVRQAASK